MAYRKWFYLHSNNNKLIILMVTIVLAGWSKGSCRRSCDYYSIWVVSCLLLISFLLFIQGLPPSGLVFVLSPLEPLGLSWLFPAWSSREVCCSVLLPIFGSCYSFPVLVLSCCCLFRMFCSAWVHHVCLPSSTSSHCLHLLDKAGCGRNWRSL